jgi:hypothetical protein
VPNGDVPSLPGKADAKATTPAKTGAPPKKPVKIDPDLLEKLLNRGGPR